MFNHQLRKLMPINKNDVLPLRIGNRLFRESCSGDKQPFASAPSNSTYECLNIWSANGFIFGITFGLNINQIKTKLVFHDDSIYAFVPRDWRHLACGVESSIPHFCHQIKNKPFKRNRRELEHL